MKIEKIDSANRENALALVLSVFMQYEAPEYSQQGIKTFTDFINSKESNGEKITVNSSPYAVDVYRKLGFVPDSDEKLSDGLRYTPMTYTKRL